MKWFLVQFSRAFLYPISADLLINMIVQIEMCYRWYHCKIVLNNIQRVFANLQTLDRAMREDFLALSQSYKDEAFSWWFKGSYMRFQVLGLDISLNVLGLDFRTHLNLRSHKKWRFGPCKLKFCAKCQTLRIYHVILSCFNPYFCLYLRLQDSGYCVLKVYQQNLQNNSSNLSFILL